MVSDCSFAKLPVSEMKVTRHCHDFVKLAITKKYPARNDDFVFIERIESIYLGKNFMEVILPPEGEDHLLPHLPCVSSMYLCKTFVFIIWPAYTNDSDFTIISFTTNSFSIDRLIDRAKEQLHKFII